MFPYSYRNTRETLGEREIEVGTRARRASVLLQFSQTFTSAIYNVWEHGGGGGGGGVCFPSIKKDVQKKNVEIILHIVEDGVCNGMILLCYIYLQLWKYGI